MTWCFAPPGDKLPMTMCSVSPETAGWIYQSTVSPFENPMYDLTKRDIGVLLSAEATEILSLTASANQLRPNLEQLRTAAANINKLLDLLEANGKKAK
jgi:hypothetical protein